MGLREAHRPLPSEGEGDREPYFFQPSTVRRTSLAKSACCGVAAAMAISPYLIASALLPARSAMRARSQRLPMFWLILSDCSIHAFMSASVAAPLLSNAKLAAM